MVSYKVGVRLELFFYYFTQLIAFSWRPEFIVVFLFRRMSVIILHQNGPFFSNMKQFQLGSRYHVSRRGKFYLS